MNVTPEITAGSGAIETSDRDSVSVRQFPILSTRWDNVAWSVRHGRASPHERARRGFVVTKASSRSAERPLWLSIGKVWEKSRS